jgi:hypothetical protein
MTTAALAARMRRLDELALEAARAGGAMLGGLVALLLPPLSITT